MLQKFTLLGVVFMMCAAAQAATISINFGTQPLAAGDVAGVVPVSNWNNGNAKTDMVNSLGQATTADLSCGGQGINSYTTDATPTTPDQNMMDSFVGGLSTSSPLWTKVVDLPLDFQVSGYDVIAYWGGIVSGRTGTWTVGYTLDLTATTYYLKYGTPNNAYWNGTYTQSFATTGASATFGPNYIRWSGLSAASFQVNLACSTQRFGISGLQIVQVPEPASLGLLGLGVLGLIRRNL